MSAARDCARQEGVEVAIKMLAQKIWNGAAVMMDVSNNAYAFTNDGTTRTLDSGDRFAGIAAETKDNRLSTVGGVDGGDVVKVYQRGTFLLPFSSGDSIAEDDKGKPVYVNNVTDDNEVSITVDGGGVDVQIGVMVDMGPSANTAWVKIDAAIGNAAA